MNLKTIITCFSVLYYVSVYAQKDLKVYLVGVRYACEKLTPIDEVQKDQYVLFYQIHSDSLSKENLDNINFSLRERYMYNLDFNFFNTSYYSVYHPIICEPRSSNILNFSPFYNNDFKDVREYDSLKFIAFAKYRQHVIRDLGIDSIADAHNDTFYVSNYFKMNTVVPLIERGIIDSAFSLIPEISVFKYSSYHASKSKAIPDSTYCTVLRDSILYIHGPEPILFDLKYPRKHYSLFEEVSDLDRIKLIDLLFDRFYRKCADFGNPDDLVATSLDFYPVIEVSAYNYVYFRFYRTPSPYYYKRYVLSFDSDVIDYGTIEPYLKKESVYRDIYQFVIEIK